MNVIEQLEQQRDFTNVERHIAEFILGNIDNVADMSIGDLASETFTSNAAIIRLCRKMEIGGYREFRVALARTLGKQRAEKTNVDFNNPFTAQEHPDSVMSSVAAISKEAINSCFSSISPEQLEQAAFWLRSAEHIFIYAVGDSYIAASAFANLLVKIGVLPILVTQYHEEMKITFGSTSKDIALMISYSGTTISRLYREIKILKKNKCRIIAITSRKENEGIDLPIVFPALEDIVGRSAGYYSYTAITYILNCLYGMIYSMDLQKNKNYRFMSDVLAGNE